MTDDDRRAGIRKFFEPEEVEDWIVETVLHALKQWNEINAQVQELANSIIGPIGFTRCRK